MLLGNYLLGMAQDVPNELLVPTIVYTMDDGGMGSIRFVTNDGDHVYQRDLINAEFTDTDGIPVFITLHLNTANKLFELDMFKGDFSPLKRYPIPQDLRSIQ
jgi:hypothetical protein